MKKIILLFIMIASIPIITRAQETTALDIKNSVVTWYGETTFGFGGHEGTVKIKSGELQQKQGKITGGKFILDMNTIANTEGGYSQDLVDHLKSEDFFDAEKHPTAELLITKIHYFDSNNTPGDPIIYIKVNADLIIKGISQPIQFNALTDDKHAEISAKFKIDRTLWGVNHRAKGFADRLKNSIISDAIQFNISLKMD